MRPLYQFNIPDETEVIKRNRTITTYYALLYNQQPELFKWAGMASFASFHIGTKLKLWDWSKSGINNISFRDTKNKRIEDDFQIIRILNNKIFDEIGGLHLSFVQLNYDEFRSSLIHEKKHSLIVHAFDRLHYFRKRIRANNFSKSDIQHIWSANIDILWHEQSKVVQPYFDQLSSLFSRAMTLFASFDYNINHQKTDWKVASRFIFFMYFNGFNLIKNNGCVPSLVNLDHRWYWICNDLIKKWQKIESYDKRIMSEINFLSQLEDRKLTINHPDDY